MCLTKSWQYPGGRFPRKHHAEVPLYLHHTMITNNNNTLLDSEKAQYIAQLPSNISTPYIAGIRTSNAPAPAYSEHIRIMCCEQLQTTVHNHMTIFVAHLHPLTTTSQLDPSHTLDALAITDSHQSQTH